MEGPTRKYQHEQLKNEIVLTLEKLGFNKQKIEEDIIKTY